MKIIAENAEAELARRRSIDDLSWALQDTTSNLMRIVRGAGNPHMLIQQLQRLLGAFEQYREVAGPIPADRISAILSMERERDPRDNVNDFELAQIEAEQQVIRGALQFAASRLVGQLTHQAKGKEEMYDGIREIERVRAERRIACQSSTRPPKARGSNRPKVTKSPRSSGASAASDDFDGK